MLEAFDARRNGRPKAEAYRSAAKTQQKPPPATLGEASKRINADVKRCVQRKVESWVCQS